MTDPSNKRFDLQYWNGNKCIEVIKRNIPFGLCKGLSKDLKNDDKYKLGKFVIKPS